MDENTEVKTTEGLIPFMTDVTKRPWSSYSIKGMWWFRIYGYGICWRNTQKHGLLFSERNGFKKVLNIRNWVFEWLKPISVSYTQDQRGVPSSFTIDDLKKVIDDLDDKFIKQDGFSLYRYCSARGLIHEHAHEMEFYTVPGCMSCREWENYLDENLKFKTNEPKKNSYISMG